MADIGSACGLLKGSVYHYFSSKEALALAVIERCEERSREKFFAKAQKEEKPAGERIRNYARGVEDFFIGQDGGCLYGNLALEAADVDPLITEKVQSAFAAWIGELANILTPKFGAVRAKEIAIDSVARLQGAIMLMRLDKDPAPLKRATRDLVAMVE